VALVDTVGWGSIVPALAERDGALIPVIETAEAEPVPLWRLVAEHAVCVNTTAAGGNASLMTLGA
jgi:RHH-type transcriptional regulator, proline utilization regulon repressor / proline dehydrogenase / delta 1-pyrroline-5-carboxylate dehydrogenase